MLIWQLDLHRYQEAWRLLVVTADWQVSVTRKQPSVVWVAAQLAVWGEQYGAPDRVEGFRPETWPMLAAACQSLQWSARPSRHCDRLKQVLEAENPALVHLELPPPLALPIVAERWQFARLSGYDLADLALRPLPYRPELPTVVAQLPQVPGVILTAGRQSRSLAQWLATAEPVYLEPIVGDPDGVVVHTGLCDRWIMATYTDLEVVAAAQHFREVLKTAHGWHFLLVQPDSSGITFTGLWVLRQPK